MKPRRLPVALGGNIAVLIYYPARAGLGTRMLQLMPDHELDRGHFKVINGHVHFHEDDAKYRKFITYDVVRQVQKISRHIRKVKLTL